jgi:hypothetical protein
MNKLTSLTGVVIAPFDWGWSIWPPQQPEDGFHIVPDDDTRVHSNKSNCWCAPHEDDEEANLWHHNADDGRDSHAMGRKLH